MSTGARRVAWCLVLLVGSFLTSSMATAPAAAQSCDPSYPDFCIGPVWEVGDLDCAMIGATDFTVYQPDEHGFDADYDGIGCEPYEGAGDFSDEAMGIVASGEALPVETGCDPSYPEICLASSPDLDCAAVGFALTVIHDPSIGAYDPHGFDADANGVGCESW